MSTATENTPVLDESVWNAWLAKGKRQQRATARKVQIIGCLLAVLAIATGFYFFAGQ
jgi:hypothetical protein